ncbi:oligosaccharide flippase family protein [Pseudomonas fluvialis]|uniref:oligosaccharide flippase family protein n=1 Tax=Pseudomonas fluvialis TaxID=1793966 RepID=UPI0012FF02BF|nr:oligosaccharide flippase family protein [Pseudomonas pharmacofabricae]
MKSLDRVLIFNKINRLVNVFISNSTILKNYFALTFLQVLNAAYFIVMLPLVLPVVGADSYGYFVYVTAVLSVAAVVINFGFDMPGIKRAAIDSIDEINLSEYFSIVFAFKFLASLILSGALFVLLNFFSVDKPELYMFCYLGVLSNVLIPIWLFQGRQKLLIVTVVQSISKLVSLLFVYALVNEPEDLVLFALIVNISNLLAGLVLFFYAISIVRCNFRFYFSSFKKVVKEAAPFFGIGAIGIIKYRSMEIFIGVFFGMKEVAIFDLANKIYAIPSMFATSINTAIFPKLAKMHVFDVRKIIVFELLVSIAFLICIVLFGSFAVDFLGAGVLSESYYVLVLMGFNILAFLIVGCYSYFVFLPKGRGDILLKNQLFALFVYVVMLCVFYLFFNNIYMVVVALVLSGLFEIIYCAFKSKEMSKVVGG